jgi:hypothetical protein
MKQLHSWFFELNDKPRHSAFCGAAGLFYWVVAAHS